MWAGLKTGEVGLEIIGGAGLETEVKDTAVTELWQHVTQAEEEADITLGDVTVQTG